MPNAGLTKFAAGLCKDLPPEKIFPCMRASTVSNLTPEINKFYKHPVMETANELNKKIKPLKITLFEAENINLATENAPKINPSVLEILLNGLGAIGPIIFKKALDANPKENTRSENYGNQLSNVVISARKKANIPPPIATNFSPASNNFPNISRSANMSSSSDNISPPSDNMSSSSANIFPPSANISPPPLPAPANISPPPPATNSLPPATNTPPLKKNSPEKKREKELVAAFPRAADRKTYVELNNKLNEKFGFQLSINAYKDKSDWAVTGNHKDFAKWVEEYYNKLWLIYQDQYKGYKYGADQDDFNRRLRHILRLYVSRAANSSGKSYFWPDALATFSRLHPDEILDMLNDKYPENEDSIFIGGYRKTRKNRMSKKQRKSKSRKSSKSRKQRRTTRKY
jgi:hypothetical protein